MVSNNQVSSHRRVSDSSDWPTWWSALVAHQFFQSSHDDVLIDRREITHFCSVCFLGDWHNHRGRKSCKEFPVRGTIFCAASLFHSVGATVYKRVYIHQTFHYLFASDLQYIFFWVIASSGSSC